MRLPGCAASYRASLFVLLAACLSACGHGDPGDKGESPTPTISEFKADSTRYFIGERARLTAVFANGSGRLHPDDIPVTSGVPIVTEELAGNIRYRLTVTDGSATVTRDLDLVVNYRERLRAIPTPFVRAEHAATRLLDGRVIVYGGEDHGNSFPDSIHAFDPATETFTQFGALRSGRVAFVSMPLDSGDVLVLGGVTALLDAPPAEIIDGRTGAVSLPAGVPLRDHLFAAASKLMDGRVLIAGGLHHAREDTTVEIYDPATRLFTLAGELQVGRSAHTIVRIDDRKFLVYGGTTSDHTAAPPELFDPVTGTSAIIATPDTTTRYLHLAHTMQDGTVFILGGMNFDSDPLTSVIAFNPADSTLSHALDLATPRAAAALARLTDGRVLITGGLIANTSGSPTDTTELITAPSQRRDGPMMSARRQLHTATRLYSGKILIIGGLDATRWPVGNAEIFE